MDKRTLVAFGGVLAVAVGVFVRDPETGDVVSSEDGSAPVSVSIAGNKAIVNGTPVSIVQNASAAVVESGNVRVPSVAGDLIIETNDYTPQEVSNAIEGCEDYAAETGSPAPRAPFWDELKAKLAEASIALPQPEDPAE